MKETKVSIFKKKKCTKNEREMQTVRLHTIHSYSSKQKNDNIISLYNLIS